MYRKALAIRQKLADDNPAVTEFRNALADCHSNLGCILPQTGKPAAAESEHQKALAIRRKPLAEAGAGKSGVAEGNRREPDQPRRRRHGGGSLRHGDFARYRESLAIHERLAHDHPTITAYRKELLGLRPDRTQGAAPEHRAGRRAAAVEPL